MSERHPHAGSKAPAEPAPEPTPETAHGYLRHVATDSYHEVEDVAAVMAAYPGQYEAAKAGTAKDKLGWPDPTPPSPE